MNLKALLKLGTASLISLGAITYFSPAISSESVETNIDRSEVLSQQVALSGEFTAAEAQTTGTGKIVESNGQT